ncbi:MAG: SGNH/GDSL hydrolase family protein [Cyanobacteria bacterium P01_A01_bin.114]
MFRHLQSHRLLEPAKINVLLVEGATAQGIANPNSKTHALARFNQRLNKAQKWQTLFFSLGEVDCGFVIWYRVQKHGSDIESQLERSIQNYIDFLISTRQSGFQNINVISAPLPTIRDGQNWGKIANLRQSVKASQLERTQLTLRYNQMLQKRCLEHGFNFIDVTAEQLDPHTHLIADSFLNEDPLDHHLDAAAYSKLLVSHLQPLLGKLPSQSTPTAAPG